MQVSAHDAFAFSWAVEGATLLPALVTLSSTRGDVLAGAEGQFNISFDKTAIGNLTEGETIGAKLDLACKAETQSLGGDNEATIQVETNALNLEVQIRSLPSIEKSKFKVKVGTGRERIWPDGRKLEIIEGDAARFEIHGIDETGSQISVLSVRDFQVAICNKHDKKGANSTKLQAALYDKTSSSYNLKEVFPTGHDYIGYNYIGP